MTKKERKIIAQIIVDTYMLSFKSAIYTTSQEMKCDKRFIEGMITGYEYTGLITTDERTEWLKEIYKEFAKMNIEYSLGE